MESNTRTREVWPDMYEGIICCAVEGITFEAKTKVHPKEMVVEVLKPVHRIEKRYLVDLAPIIYTNEPMEGSSASEIGIESIKNIIREIAEELCYSSSPGTVSY